jgi:hypothetical protein
MSFSVLARARALSCLAGACLALHAGRAAADPADYVFVPYAEKGALRAAWSFGAEDATEGGRERAQSLSLGGSPTARWFTEAYAGWYAEPGASSSFDEWAWRNQLLLTAPGEGPADVAAMCEIERPRERAEGTGLVCGALLQLDTDHVQLNFNPLVTKVVDAQAATTATLGYQWQAKTLVRPFVELGAQGFGDVGPWNHWAGTSSQEHVLGPALFARWPQGGGRVLSLDTAWLFGIGAGSPANTLRLRLEQKF